MKRRARILAAIAMVGAIGLSGWLAFSTLKAKQDRAVRDLAKTRSDVAVLSHEVEQAHLRGISGIADRAMITKERLIFECLSALTNLEVRGEEVKVDTHIHGGSLNADDCRALVGAN